MEKMILTQDTSNVDDTGMSSDEKRERSKRRRREKAKRKFSSSSEDEEFVENKENHPKQKKLPPFPPLEKFVSKSTTLKEKSVPQLENMINDDLTEIDVASPVFQSQKGCTTTTDRRDKEDSCMDEFKKQVLFKLNRILYKMERLENKIEEFGEKIKFEQSNVDEECNLSFLLRSLEELNNFEEQLQESQFKNKVVNTLRLVDGNSSHIMTHNVLKKIFDNTLAAKYSWAGMKRLIFKDLAIAKIVYYIIQKKSASKLFRKSAYKKKYMEFRTSCILDNSRQYFEKLEQSFYSAEAVRSQIQCDQSAELAESISKWLAQAPLRIQRQMKHQEK